VEELQKSRLPDGVVVRKSDVFMNESGVFVKKLVDKYKPDLSDLYIIHDDLDIPLGSYKIQFGVGPKVHNGVNSVETEIGTKEFWRVRIGIENRIKNKESGTRGENYVLENFSDDERVIIGKVIKEACKKLVKLLTNTN
jgi:PTH1 family peptidyl-tRNA hydrolase